MTLRSKGQFATRKQYALHTLIIGLKELKKVRWRQCLCIGFLIGVYGIAIPLSAYKPEPTIIINEAHAEEATPPVETPVLIEVRIDWTKERIEQEVRSTFPETPNTAVAVAKSESGKALLPTAYNPEWHYDRNGNKVCQGSYGVMQIACVHMKHNPEALYDVETNLEVARKIYESEGWAPWGGYTSGSWKNHI